MFFQTVLQSLLKKKKGKPGKVSDLDKKEHSPLVQRILMEMRKHSATKKSGVYPDKESSDQNPK
jgi:hypothetical protein